MATYIVNSSTSGDTYRARVYNISDDSDATLSVAEYPKDGTVDLSNGKGGDTEYTPKVGDAVYWIQWINRGVSYNIYALEFKEGDVVDTYIGNEKTPISLRETNKPYVLDGVTSWKMLEAIPPIVQSASSEIYISVRASAETVPMPDGVAINIINDRNNTAKIWTLTDIGNVPSDVTFQSLNVASAGFNGVVTGDNSGCVSDFEREKAWQADATNPILNFELNLPAGTYNLLLSASTTNTSQTASIGEYTVDGVMKTINAYNGSPQLCETWTNVVSDGVTPVEISVTRQAGSSTAKINSIRVEEV